MPNTRMCAIAARFDSHGLEKVAIIKAETVGSMRNEDLRPIIGKALQDWIEETDEGKQASKEHGTAFNVGDLYNELPCPSLEARLARHGIFSIDIEVAVDEIGDEGWKFDTPLLETPIISRGSICRGTARAVIVPGVEVRWKRRSKDITLKVTKILPDDMYEHVGGGPEHPILLSEITHVVYQGHWTAVESSTKKLSVWTVQKIASAKNPNFIVEKTLLKFEYTLRLREHDEIILRCDRLSDLVTEIERLIFDGGKWVLE